MNFNKLSNGLDEITIDGKVYYIYGHTTHSGYGFTTCFKVSDSNDVNLFQSANSDEFSYNDCMTVIISHARGI